MSKQLFALNKTLANLILKAGYVTIPRGQYVTISEDDASHPDFKDAVTKDWLVISEKEPKGADVPAVKAIEVVNPVQGMTAAELKASQSEEPEPIVEDTPSETKTTRAKKAAE